MKSLLSLFFIISMLHFSCKQKNRKPVTIDKTITGQTSFNNLFFDSIQLEKFLAEDSSFSKYKEQFYDFYKERNYQFAWFDTSGLAEQTHNFYNLLNATVSELQDSSLLNLESIKSYQYFTENSVKGKASSMFTQVGSFKI
jgi:uncharacterized protein YcfL